MPTTLNQREHTDAIVAALESVAPVGRGVRNSDPDDSETFLDPPCYVLHPISVGRRYGTVDDWTVNADLVYQVTCVGLTQRQAEWLRDASELLLSGVSVAGRHIDIVRSDFGSSSVNHEEVAGETLFTAMPRYRFMGSTPD